MKVEDETMKLGGGIKGHAGGREEGHAGGREEGYAEWHLDFVAVLVTVEL